MTTIKTFPLLALEQWERVILAHNVEFRGGFYMQTSVAGELKEMYVPDSREVFCNTCEALAILILPASDKRFAEQYEGIKQELKELNDKFLDETSVNETIVLGEAFYQKEEDKILLEEYNNKRVEVYRKLFKALSEEFRRHKYWKTTTISD